MLREDRIPVMAASASFWAWCALLSYPMIAGSYPVYAASQATGLLMFLATMSVWYFFHFNSTLGRLQLAQAGILLIIGLSLLVQFHGDEFGILSGILYTCLLPSIALSLAILWTLQPADFERCMSVASVILCLFGITAIAVLGWPERRDIGGILQPNIFAVPLLTALIFSQFHAGRAGIIVRILCFAMVAVVSSRFALIGCITAVVLYEMTFDPLSPAKIPALVVALATGIFFWPQIGDVLALDDPTRGLSSGFSGRDDRWQLAFDAISDHPFGIGFKRSIGEESGHNGYLKTLLEFGVAGGGLLIFLIACIVIFAGVDAIKRAGKSRQQRRFDCARFAGLAALLFGAFFQPQVFSLGDTFGISFLLLLFKPAMNSVPAREPHLTTAELPLMSRARID
jgi:O-antigen ligase